MGRFTEQLAQMARRELLNQLSQTDRMIRRYYLIAAKDIEKQIANAKAGSLTERWLTAYLESIHAELDTLGGRVQGAITGAAQAAAEARAAATEKWLERVAGDAGVALNQSFRETLTAAPTDALRAMIDGSMYADGRRLSARIWTETGRLEGNIREILAQGVAQQMDTIQLARLLEAYVDPDQACPVSWHTLYPDIPFERKIDYNALRLARTTITQTYWAVGKAAAKANPLCRGLKWHLSNSHYERQVESWGEDVCDEYAKHDEGLGVGVWPVDKVPMPHPNCLCYQTEAVPTIEQAAGLVDDWAKGKTQSPEMDAAFERWKKENAGELKNWYTTEQALKMELDKSGKFDTMETERWAKLMLQTPTIHDDKIYKFMLRPGSKHAETFEALGYTTEDGERLRADIIGQYRRSPMIDISYDAEHKGLKYSTVAELGSKTKKKLRIAWMIMDDGDNPAKFVSAYDDRRLRK